MSCYFDLKISLSHTKPVVWRRVLLPHFADLNTLCAAIEASFAWDGQGEWSCELDQAHTLYTHFGEHDTLTLYYEREGQRWEHEVRREVFSVERDESPWRIFVGGEHPAPFDDIGSPEQFALLLELKAKQEGGEELDPGQMPEGYEMGDLELLRYDEQEVREHVEVATKLDFDTSISQSFERFLEERWDPEMPQRALKLAVFAEVERGCHALGLSREQVLVSYGYWGLMLDETIQGMYESRSEVIAASIVKLIDDTQLDAEEEVMGLMLPELYAAFGINPSHQGELGALLEAMRPVVSSIDVCDAASVAMDLYNASMGGVENADDLSARQRAELMWQEPMGPEMLEWSEQRDFIMYVACEKLDPAEAPEDDDPPNYLFVATDEVQDRALAVLPWYGELDDAQRHAALFRTVLVASAVPSFGEPARPIGIVLSTEAEAVAVGALYPFEDTPVMSMAGLSRRMSKEASRKASTRRKVSGNKSSAQKKARKKNRKKKK